MKKSELTRLIKEELKSIREEETQSGKGKLISALDKAGVDTHEPVNIKLINKETGKEKIVTMNSDGTFSDAGVEEGFKDKLVIGATCFILASGLVSCQKEDLYNISSDARYIVKPEILNTLGKKAFDSPGAGAKDKVYMWFGNQGGNGTRYPYYDYTNQNKDYGAVYGQKYPDSLVAASNGITPNEVININSTEATTYPLTPEQKANYKYIVLVKVHPSTQWNWTDLNNGKEESSGWNSGYALYLTNMPAVQVGDLYPTMLANTGRSGDKYGIVRDASKAIAIGDYVTGKGQGLLQSEPQI